VRRLGVGVFKVVLFLAMVFELFVRIVVVKLAWLLVVLMAFVGRGVRGVTYGERRLTTEG
jgi:hypothetical protein